jgi:hypothetical protein
MSLSSPCPLQRRGFFSFIKVLSLGEDLGEANDTAIFVK